ncbi:unnamed protein product [Calicophoron daubneyi]|uniref:Uncharacterized protein n=1 Tax=Calicophoron daubneyi TaxID=300641 RepID=A0AAV2TU29_CALDB
MSASKTTGNQAQLTDHRLSNLAMAAFVGDWKREKAENYDKICEKLGISNELIQKIRGAESVIKVRELGDGRYHVVRDSVFGPVDIKFKFGEEVEYTGLDGKQVKVTVYQLSPTKIEQKQKRGDLELNSIGEVNGNEMTQSIQHGGYTCKMTFKKI